MKGTKLLEAKIKAEERQKAKSFMPSDAAATIEAEDGKVCVILLSLSYKTYAFLRPKPPSPPQLQNKSQRRQWKQQQLARNAKHP
jgi:hypothetical protein